MVEKIERIKDVWTSDRGKLLSTVDSLVKSTNMARLGSEYEVELLEFLGRFLSSRDEMPEVVD